MTGAAWAGVLLLLLPHGKEGSYDRSDLKKKEPLGVFSVISVGFVQGALCYYQPALPFCPILSVSTAGPDCTESNMRPPS